jgi:hypothetical protein
VIHSCGFPTVLASITNHPVNRFGDLLPWNLIARAVQDAA